MITVIKKNKFWLLKEIKNNILKDAEIARLKSILIQAGFSVVNLFPNLNPHLIEIVFLEGASPQNFSTSFWELLPIAKNSLFCLFFFAWKQRNKTKISFSWCFKHMNACKSRHVCWSKYPTGNRALSSVDLIIGEHLLRGRVSFNQFWGLRLSI